MSKNSYIITGAFLVAIGGISVGSLLAKDREFSPNENRYLSGVPTFSVDRIFSGDFQEDLENYLNDQILGRDQWITAKTAIQKSCGDTDIGGAYVGKDGYDFEKILPEDIDDKLVNRNIQSVQQFLEKSTAQVEKDHMSFLLVPTSGLVMKEYLPKNAILFDQEAYMDRVKDALKEYRFMDGRKIFQSEMDSKTKEASKTEADAKAKEASKTEADSKTKADKALYYRTDHHWTTYGAFVAFEEWCKQTEHSFEGIDAYETETVTKQFRGSLYSKILDYDSAYDSIVKMTKKQDATAYKVIADGKDIGGFYQEDKLQEKDKYAYFFGGNYGEVAIEGTQEGKGNLLVIKDSFANAFVPFLADSYDNIYMVDLRYFNEDMQAYLKEKNITDILVLYNVSNFVTDRNLYKLK